MSLAGRIQCAYVGPEVCTQKSTRTSAVTADAGVRPSLWRQAVVTVPEDLQPPAVGLRQQLWGGGRSESLSPTPGVVLCAVSGVSVCPCCLECEKSPSRNDGGFQKTNRYSTPCPVSDKLGLSSVRSSGGLAYVAAIGESFLFSHDIKIKTTQLRQRANLSGSRLPHLAVYFNQITN